MRKILFGSSLTAIMAGAMLIGGGANEANAGVNVGIGINLGPPPIVAPAPAEVVPVPGNGVYFVPGLDFDVFFYNGFWWSPRGDRWYRSRAYNGPWYRIGRRYVPRPVFRMPHDYRQKYYRERRIPYGEWREHRRGWNRHERGRDFRDRGEHRGRGYDR